MQFILNEFCQVNGLGAASGLVYRPPSIYLISDYSSYLYCYHIEEKQLDKIELFVGQAEFLAKADKFDFEAMLQHDQQLYLFGSGSTERRNTLVRYCLADQSTDNVNLDSSQQTISPIDLTVLYAQFKQVANLANDELNIEGVIYHSSQWLFFQRGNGAQGINGIFTLQCADINDSLIKDLSTETLIEFAAIELPKIKNVSSSFTDAILVDETIYFLASAEDSQSTYADGEVLGSYMGCIDLTTKKLIATQLISTGHKFEGLTLYKQKDSRIEFLLCADDDSPNDKPNSTLYHLTVQI